VSIKANVLIVMQEGSLQAFFFAVNLRQNR